MKYITILAMLAITFGAEAQSDSAKKPIPVQKFKIWVQGQLIDAEDIEVKCVEDDFKNYAVFFYIMRDSTGKQLAAGNLEMRGADYRAYSTQNNHAQRGTNWVLQQLNIQRRQQQAAARAAAAAASSGTTNQQ
jgi:hypothetical protein